MHKQERFITVLLPSLSSTIYTIGLSLLGLGIATFIIIFRVTEQFITFYSDG